MKKALVRIVSLVPLSGLVLATGLAACDGMPGEALGEVGGLALAGADPSAHPPPPHGPPPCTSDAQCDEACPPDAIECACVELPPPQVCLPACAEDGDCPIPPNGPSPVCRTGVCVLDGPPPPPPAGSHGPPPPPNAGDVPPAGTGDGTHDQPPRPRGPRPCADANDCSDACPPDSLDCVCATPPPRSTCLPVCADDADCPAPEHGPAAACNDDGVCVVPPPPAPPPPREQKPARR